LRSSKGTQVLLLQCAGGPPLLAPTPALERSEIGKVESIFFALGDAESQLAGSQALVLAAGAVGLFLADGPEGDEVESALPVAAVVGDALQDGTVLLLGGLVGQLRQRVLLVFEKLYGAIDRDLLPHGPDVLPGLGEADAFLGVDPHHAFEQVGEQRRVDFPEFLEVLAEQFLVEGEGAVVGRVAGVVPARGVEQHGLQRNHRDPEHLHLLHAHPPQLLRLHLQEGQALRSNRQVLIRLPGVASHHVVVQQVLLL
jgi:hypothetical protein